MHAGTTHVEPGDRCAVLREVRDRSHVEDLIQGQFGVVRLPFGPTVPPLQVRGYEHRPPLHAVSQHRDALGQRCHAHVSQLLAARGVPGAVRQRVRNVLDVKVHLVHPVGPGRVAARFHVRRFGDPTVLRPVVRALEVGERGHHGERAESRLAIQAHRHAGGHATTPYVAHGPHEFRVEPPWIEQVEECAAWRFGGDHDGYTNLLAILEHHAGHVVAVNGDLRDLRVRSRSDLHTRQRCQHL